MDVVTESEVSSWKRRSSMLASIVEASKDTFSRPWKPPVLLLLLIICTISSMSSSASQVCGACVLGASCGTAMAMLLT